MTDLISVMSKLVSPEGKILVPGVQELVPPPTKEELAIYERLDYSIADVESSAGGPIALSADKGEVLMGRMREPSLSLHGIEGAFYGAGAKTVIPARVAGKFSIRWVPPSSLGSIH
jgi:Cys-Gly metallodipeptidase DUG1